MKQGKKKHIFPVVFAFFLQNTYSEEKSQLILRQKVREHSLRKKTKQVKWLQEQVSLALKLRSVSSRKILVG